MRDKIKIDLVTGLMVDVVHPSERQSDITETPCLESYIIPKWNGESWEEGATQEYIDNLKAQAEPQEPTLEEKVAEHDEKIVTMEETINVIFGGV